MADDDMCPNCITPWKCNGPHRWIQAEAWPTWHFAISHAYVIAINGLTLSKPRVAREEYGWSVTWEPTR